MDPNARAELEAEIRRAFDGGDRAGAAAAAVRGYGPEVFGFLVAFHHDAIDAEEVWSRVTERLWKGLDRFAWESSFRTWIYAIARKLSAKLRRNDPLGPRVVLTKPQYALCCVTGVMRAILHR